MAKITGKSFDNANKLEEKLIDAIQSVCITREIVEECKEYFKNTLISGLIEDNSEDLE